MIHNVPLGEFPGDLEVPDELKNRFWYDVQRQSLCFDGFMSKATFERLGRLKRDRPYQHALEELFRISVPEEKHDEPAITKIPFRLAAVMGIVALGCLAVWLLMMKTGS